MVIRLGVAKFSFRFLLSYTSFRAQVWLPVSDNHSYS